MKSDTGIVYALLFATLPAPNCADSELTVGLLLSGRATPRFESDPEVAHSTRWRRLGSSYAGLTFQFVLNKFSGSYLRFTLARRS